MNLLYYGDNLPILRDHVPTASVDLIYLDPPFNSNRSYNVLFKEESGLEGQAQIQAFDDAWHWGPVAEATYQELVARAPMSVATMISAFRQFIGANQILAYLVMMTARLVELHRVLKPAGSLYLHCDPTASHYLKIILDTIFGTEKFRTEIVWKRSSAHSDAKQGRKLPGRIHDLLLFYTKSDDWTWNPVYTAYDQTYVEQAYRQVEERSGRRYQLDNLTAAKPGGDTRYEWRVKRPQESGERWQSDLEEEFVNPVPGWEYMGVPPYKGRFWAYSRPNMIQFAREGRVYHTASGQPRYIRYLDEMPGVPLQDLWTDVPPALGAQDMGYPTQKPVALLERIIQASSNPGDVVLDPFCGCGTTIAAAQKLGRAWIGIDVTHLAIALQKYRLKDSFGLMEGRDYKVIGEPTDVQGARKLARDDRYQFQWWALSLIKARPLGGEAGSKEGKKGSDKGVDGLMTFIDDPTAKAKIVLVQVKSGKVKSGDIRDLHGVLQSQKADMGVFITMDEPTSDMAAEAVAAGFYHSPGWGKDYPRLQIVTVAGLLSGAELKMPPAATTFKQAGRVQPEGVKQVGMGM